MKRLFALFIICAMLLVIPACGTAEKPQTDTSLPTVDPSGAEISIPENVESIIVLAPSLAETVVALGEGDKIVGYDLNSVGLDGLPENVPTFDTVAPDVEQLMAIAPDVLLVSSLSLYDQEAPYQPLIDAGICVICVPTSESIDGIKSDIEFIASALSVPKSGETLISELNAELDELSAIAATIPENERKSVYFEISAAPYMYSCGSDTYLSEMIELIGANNILADQSGWLSVEPETVVAADPDVIFTNVNYLDDPIQEILDRDGWAGVTAVKNGDVYYIDNAASSIPDRNIVVALRQMAEALYPDYYAS